MISTRWLEKRKPYWLRLEQYVDRSKGRGVAALDHSELKELGLLYRQTASDLAIVREDITSNQLGVYLNSLLGRAHNLIYMGHRPKMSGIRRFYSQTFPQVFRKTLPQTALAFGIFAVTGLAASVLTLHDPTFAHRLLGAKMMETIDRREMWTESIVTIKPLAASVIMTNNLSVTFMTFALGITCGIGTAWMMIVNGLLIGVVGAATFRAGMAVALWSFVAPHGVLELPAIFIAGGAGFEIARGMLFPGLLPRGESIVARELRHRFHEAGVFVISLVSSPGAGKTALLEKTLTLLRQESRVAALVGDLATENDAVRLARSQAPVKQIVTGTVCHLEAAMVQNALERWNLAGLDFLFIENVGNLVCPSSYDLGEDLRLVLMSVTEGEDKPLKYPTIFNSADVALITKMDLAEAVEFDAVAANRSIQAVRPGITRLDVSAKSGAGMNAFLDFLRSRRAAALPTEKECTAQ